MRRILFGLLLLVAGSIGTQAQGLKDAYQEYFKVGVAVNKRNIAEAEQIALVKREFNSITAENDMKPGMVHPAEGVWKWGTADSIANFARENGIKLRGHCLCWHSQFCDWMFTDKKGRPVKKEVFYQRLREHIHTVVNRYKDVVYCWDVVNEAMADQAFGWPGHPANPYRESTAYKLCGDEFIAKAFEYAHEADPNALLFYNDYNECDPGKRDRIYNMVKKMQEQGVPIHGIGMQGHYNVYGPSEEDVEAAITKYSELVKHIHVTELDLRTNTEQGGQLRFSRGEAKPLAPYLQTLQEDQYNRLFRIFRKHRDVIDCVTFWNLSDRDSWLGQNNHPLRTPSFATSTLCLTIQLSRRTLCLIPSTSLASSTPWLTATVMHGSASMRLMPSRLSSVSGWAVVVAPCSARIRTAYGQALPKVLWTRVSTTTI